jgi:alkylated DNA repair dioxygenase AlkB
VIEFACLQDKDESEQSIDEGLPVVSFSIGDTAEFLYGDERDVDKAKKVLLESGDVLIFGGKARNVFHGVNAIQPETAPSRLLEETNLRKPGRLNLTFRQY